MRNFNRHLHMATAFMCASVSFAYGAGLLHEDAVLQTTVAMCAAAAGFILCIMSFLGIWQIRKRATVEVCYPPALLSRPQTGNSVFAAATEA